MAEAQSMNVLATIFNFQYSFNEAVLTFNLSSVVSEPYAHCVFFIELINNLTNYCCNDSSSSNQSVINYCWFVERFVLLSWWMLSVLVGSFCSTFGSRVHWCSQQRISIPNRKANSNRFRIHDNSFKFSESILNFNFSVFEFTQFGWNKSVGKLLLKNIDDGLIFVELSWRNYERSWILSFLSFQNKQTKGYWIIEICCFHFSVIINI